MSKADVERLARIIEGVRWKNALRIFTGAKNDSMAENQEYVRAILRALREPTPEMLMAAFTAHLGASFTARELQLCTPDKSWTCIIDHLLDEME